MGGHDGDEEVDVTIKILHNEEAHYAAKYQEQADDLWGNNGKKTSLYLFSLYTTTEFLGGYRRCWQCETYDNRSD